MAEKVGKLHIHDLPYNRDLPVREDVYKCYCGKEFIVEDKTETRFGKDNKKWVELDGSLAVEYDRTVNGEKFIGRAGPDTVFDEEVSDGGESTRVESGGDSGNSADSGSSE